MPLLPTLLRLLLVAALAVNGWVLPAHAMPGDASAATAAATATDAAGAEPLVVAAAPALGVATREAPVEAAARAGSGCHDAAGRAVDLPASDGAPATATVAVDAAGDCCDTDGCSDCRCTMAGGVALAPAARSAAAPRTAALAADPVSAPRARATGQPLRPPIA